MPFLTGKNLDTELAALLVRYRPFECLHTSSAGRLPCGVRPALLSTPSKSKPVPLKILRKLLCEKWNRVGRHDTSNPWTPRRVCRGHA